MDRACEFWPGSAEAGLTLNSGQDSPFSTTKDTKFTKAFVSFVNFVVAPQFSIDRPVVRPQYTLATAFGRTPGTVGYRPWSISPAKRSNR